MNVARMMYCCKYPIKFSRNMGPGAEVILAQVKGSSTFYVIRWDNKHIHPYLALKLGLGYERR